MQRSAVRHAMTKAKNMWRPMARDAMARPIST